MYRTGKSNACANALSRKAEDVQEQQKAIEQHRTQTIIPQDKIDQAIINNLKLDGQTSKPYFPGLAGQTNDQQQVPALAALEEEEGYNSLQLVDCILKENRTSPKLHELRTKAIAEQSDNT